jgi:hypothetical protein
MPYVSAVYATPEEAALSEWSGYPSASAHVVAVRDGKDADHVIVVVDTRPSDPEGIECMRRPDGTWEATGSISG